MTVVVPGYSPLLCGVNFGSVTGGKKSGFQNHQMVATTVATTAPDLRKIL